MIDLRALTCRAISAHSISFLSRSRDSGFDNRHQIVRRLHGDALAEQCHKQHTRGRDAYALAFGEREKEEGGGIGVG